MTLSIAGRCARTGQLGVAIASSSPAVAARCAYVRAGVGAATTQNITDPRLGPALLDLMASSRFADQAVAEVVDREPLIAFRQLTAIDRTGRTGVHSGSRTLGIHGESQGTDCVVAANLLANEDVPAAMTAAFQAVPSDALGQRLIDALAAGIAAGGEAGPVHSAGLLIAHVAPWPLTDLRCDWSENPIGGLRELWAIWEPQATDYVTRALEPDAAPSYGVPGDPGSR